MYVFTWGQSLDSYSFDSQISPLPIAVKRQGRALHGLHSEIGSK